MIAHGVGSSPRFVRDAFEDPLARAGYRLVTYDLRGHGESTPVPDPDAHALTEQAADLGAVATVAGARLVGGISLGGHAAVTWARTAPSLDGVVVCLPAWLGRVPPGAGPHAVIAGEVRSMGVEGSLGRVAGDPEVPGWLSELLVRDWSRCDPTSLGAALVSLDDADGPTSDVLEELRAPVGICAWPDDPGHPLEVAEDWVSTLPCGALGTTTMAEVGADPAMMGRTVLRALAEARTAGRE